MDGGEGGIAVGHPSNHPAHNRAPTGVAPDAGRSFCRHLAELVCDVSHAPGRQHGQRAGEDFGELPSCTETLLPGPSENRGSSHAATLTSTLLTSTCRKTAFFLTFPAATTCPGGPMVDSRWRSGHPQDEHPP